MVTPEITWGDLETRGGVFLGRMEDEGDSITEHSSTIDNTSLTSSLNQTMEIKEAELEIHVPLLFVASYSDLESSMEKGTFPR